MASMPEHAHRAADHRQPRDRRVDHTSPGFVRPPDPATGVNAGPPSDRDGAGDAPDEALEEFADVLICLVGTALHQGYTEADVAQAVLSKTLVNTRREWEQALDGTWQHRVLPPASGDTP